MTTFDRSVFSVFDSTEGKQDYRRLARTVFEAVKAFHKSEPSFPKSSYDKSWEAMQYTPWFPGEMLYVLNHPNAAVHDLWINYRDGEAVGQKNPFTEEIYKSTGTEDLELVIAITNALRHTITPAHVSY